MIDVDAYTRAFRQLPPTITEAEVNAERHKLCIVHIHDGKVISGDQSETLAFYLRVSGDKTGYFYTQDLQDDPEKVIREAYEHGRFSESPFPDEMRRGTAAVSLDFGEEEAEYDLHRVEEFGAGFEAEILTRAPRSVKLNITLRAETIGLRTVNSNGLDVGFERPLYVVNATAVAERNGRQYTATYNRTASNLQDFSAEEFCRNLVELLESQYDPRPFLSGYYPAILRNNVAYNIFSTAWQLFSGQRYIEGSSMLAGRLGEAVAAECLSIRDYPARLDSGFDIPCDCEGSPGISVDLLERGVFKGLMHNLSTAKALGAEPTGNAGRRPLLSGSIPTEIQVVPRNFCIEPGSSTLDEMLTRMGFGVLITESFDVFHSIDIASGAFSIPCKGVLVHDGKRHSATGPLVLSGDLGTLLKRIEEVGDDFYIGTMLALDNYGIGACSLRVEALSVSGT